MISLQKIDTADFITKKSEKKFQNFFSSKYLGKNSIKTNWNKELTKCCNRNYPALPPIYICARARARLNYIGGRPD